MLRSVWDERMGTAQPRWQEGIDWLTKQGHSRALEMLLDRLLILSDGFRVEPRTNFLIHLDTLLASYLTPKEQERWHLKLIRSHSPYVVSRSMNRLMSWRSEAALDELFRIGDGPNRELAKEAISSLSSYSPNARIIQYLRRKMTSDDPSMALDAAITSCYSGDASGGALVVRCMKSDDPDLRLKAIAQVVDADQFRPHRATIVRSLLDELKNPTSDAHLERAIESLGAYPSDAVQEVLTPFLKHQNPQVAQRAQMSISEIMRAKGR